MNAGHHSIGIKSLRAPSRLYCLEGMDHWGIIGTPLASPFHPVKVMIKDHPNIKSCLGHSRYTIGACASSSS
ncbi:hypothetical protein NL676_033335 [Syzygium grande]|nr:hypothetical protein NL676_033335 [Syzygium grande]